MQRGGDQSGAGGTDRDLSHDLEKQIAQWQAEKSAVAERLADPALYAGAARVEILDLQTRDTGLAAQIETAELRWLEIHEALETLPGA